MEKKKLVKRKKQVEKPKHMEQDPFAYNLSEVKETVVTETFYQPIPLSILKNYLPSVMVVE